MVRQPDFFILLRYRRLDEHYQQPDRPRTRRRITKFKASTQNLLPKDKGLALDSFESVRDVHNSFATENDKLYVDVRLKDDAKAANAKKRAQDRWKGRKGRKKAKMVDDDETGLHFVAFVPANGSVVEAGRTGA